MPVPVQALDPPKRRTSYVPLLGEWSLTVHDVHDEKRCSGCLRFSLRHVIDPYTSPRLLVWDICTTVSLLFTCVVTPFEAAFLEPSFGTLFLVHRCVDAMFVVDMALQCRISVPDPVCPTIMIRSADRIARNYLQRCFVPDLISLIPFDICYMQGMERGFPLLGERSWALLRCATLARLLRLSRIARLTARWHTSFGFSYSSLSLATFFLCVVLCCHFMACLWGGLGVMEQEFTWIDALRQAKGGPAEVYQGPAQVYILSLYWAVITLTSIGYGDVVPQTSREYWVATLCASVAASVWAYVIGAVCGILSSLAPHEMNFRRTMDDLNWLLGQHTVPHPMRKKLRRYLHETRDVARQRVEKEVIEHISPKLQGELAHFMHETWIRKVWYLREMPFQLLTSLSRSLTLAAYCPDEEILAERTLCIIRRGVCALKGRVMVSGDVWGEDMLLSNERLRVTSVVRSLSYLSLLKLHMQALAEAVINFPEARARLRWAQVQLATLRGVQKIARAVQRYHKKDWTKMRDMSDEVRKDFIEGVLKGRFASAVSSEFCTVEDIFDVETESISRKTSCKSMKSRKSHRSTRKDVSLEQLDDKINKLSTAVQLLTCRMESFETPMVSQVPTSYRSSTSNLGPLIFRGGA